MGRATFSCSAVAVAAVAEPWKHPRFRSTRRTVLVRLALTLETPATVIASHFISKSLLRID